MRAEDVEYCGQVPVHGREEHLFLVVKMPVESDFRQAGLAGCISLVTRASPFTSPFTCAFI